MAKKLSVLGVGSFGEFMIPHLLPYFHVYAHEPHRDISALSGRYCITAIGFEQAADADVIVLAPPVQEIEAVARRLAPHLRPGTLVLDVCSVKVEPLRLLVEILPAHCAIVGTHPLFGPQSGRDGIAGLNISVCEVRGGRGPRVAAFLRDELKLTVIETSPEEHDRQLAYVQGLTHLLARIIVDMDMPAVTQTTATFDSLKRMVDIVRHDSEQLFRAIENRNPFVEEVRQQFFRSATRIEARLHAQYRKDA